MLILIHVFCFIYHSAHSDARSVQDASNVFSAILSKSVCGAVVQITGQEDAMYEAKVKVTTKGRKNDLPVKSGDAISIIRTTNCPKGKWLAKDSSNNCEFRILLATGSQQE